MRITVFAVLFLVLINCQQGMDENEKFVNLAGNYLERMLELNPEWATSLGDHRFDHRLNDYSLQGVQENLNLNRLYLDSLYTISTDKLSEVNRIDIQILKHNLKSMIFSLDTLKEYQKNPLYYNIGGAVYGLIARDFAPLKERMISVMHRLEGVSEVLGAARKNLNNPPRVHTETAILQNKGNISLIQNDLDILLSQVPDIREEFEPVQQNAIRALEDYGVWLEKELLPQSTGEFRLGDKLYRKKLHYTLESNLSKETILEMAEKDLVDTQNNLYLTALELHRQLFPGVMDNATLQDKKAVIKNVLDKLAEEHPTNETIVDLAKQTLHSCTEFVAANHLVSVPENPLEVIVMPEFQRGVAVAYCDSPGPLEEGGETFFAISPTPADWSQERVNSFFREYNDYMLQDLTIHEAMPGHYLQLAHANRFQAPTPVRAIFYSGPFVEGWATYAEQLMVEAGYMGPELKMQQLKMRLRLIINAIIDQKIHTANMSEQEAMDLMMNEGFQEEGEAAGKWRRACLTSTQLSTYFVGNIEINEIRNGYTEKHGGEIDLKTMHDLMLSFGSPAPKYVKQLMGI